MSFVSSHGTDLLATNPVLVGFELLASSVWLGSLVCLAVVASAARSALDAPSRIAFFRSLGRRYGIVGNLALAVAIGVGLAMAWPPSTWGPLEDAAIALAGVLVVATALGIVQARAIGRLRRRSLAAPEDGVLARKVRRGAIAASVLRSVLAVVSLAILALAARLIGG